MKKHLLLLALIALAVAGCARPTPSSLTTDSRGQGVINGENKTKRDSAASRSVILLELLNSRGTVLTFCSGSLIGAHTVLTAAHCFDPKTVIGVAGFRVLFEGVYSEWGHREQRQGLGFTRHPQYNSTKYYDHDIAVAVFSGNIPSGFNTVAIDEDVSANYSNEIIYAYGYGRTADYTGRRGEDLRYSAGTLYRGRMKISMNYNLYPDRYFTLENWPTHLCQGDSGGPQFLEKNGTLKVIGVNSASYGEKLANGVQSCLGKSQATKVSRFAGWLHEQEQLLLKNYH